MSTESNNETPKKMMTLKSSDGEAFKVEEQAAVLSQTIKSFVEDGYNADTPMPIPNVSGPILALVIEYSKKHSAEETKAELKAFDAEFVKVEDSMFFKLILAANYLNIKSLLDLTCQAVADKIKDMPVEQVREMFNITNGFTQEEEQAIRNEHAVYGLLLNIGDEHGVILRNKALLVAQGYTQVEGIDFDETFAHVASQTLRIPKNPNCFHIPSAFKKQSSLCSSKIVEE